MFLPTSEPVVSEHLEATARLTSLGASPTIQTHVPQIAVLQFLGTTDREMGTVHFKSFAWSDGGEDLNSRNASDSMLKNQIFSCCVYTLQYLDRGFAFSQHARLHPRSLAALEPSPLILTLVRKCCTVPHVTSRLSKCQMSRTRSETTGSSHISPNSKRIAKRNVCDIAP